MKNQHLVLVFLGIVSETLVVVHGRTSTLMYWSRKISCLYPYTLPNGCNIAMGSINTCPILNLVSGQLQTQDCYQFLLGEEAGWFDVELSSSILALAIRHETWAWRIYSTSYCILLLLLPCLIANLPHCLAMFIITLLYITATWLYIAAT